MAIGCCENIIKYVLFFVNLLLMLAGFVVLGFSIYGLVDSQSASKAIESGAHLVAGEEGGGFSLSNLYTWVCVTFIVVSSVIILVTFLGCCGAWKENNCLLFLNFIILLILLCGTIAGTVILYFQNLDVIKPSLVQSLKNYVPHPVDQVSDEPLTSAWDDIQMQFSCCGIDGYSDFTNASIFEMPIYPDRERNFVPASCCWGLLDDNVMADCRRRPNDAAYVDRTRGCFSEFQKTLLTNRDAVGIATLTIVAFLFINLVAVFTFTMWVMPMSGYAPVHRM